MSGSAHETREPAAAAHAPTNPRPAPLDAGERIQALDILRGLALFGMILVHFHQRMRIEVTGIEDLVGWGVWILVEQKAWGTFAFLFGAGFAILLRRLEARGEPVVAVYLRRLTFLAALGLVAEVGLGFGILLQYAYLGVVLLLIRRWSTRALLFVALLGAMARPVAAELSALWAWWASTPLEPSAARALAQAVEVATEHGSYLDLVAARWRLFLASTPGGWQGLLPDSNLTLFVVGLLAVRHGVLDDPLRHRRRIAAWMAFGAVSWASYWLLLRHVPDFGIPGADWPLAVGLGLVQDQWLTFPFVGAVLLLLASRPVWCARLFPVGQAGRMALTNYMVQAVWIDALASGYGLGLELRPYHYTLAALAFFTAEAAFSCLWLAYFRFGPLEWLWRLVTYGRHESLVRKDRMAVAPARP